MKRNAKFMIIAAAALMVATGCQKNDEQIDVTLKSSGVMTVVNNWKSGNAVAECAEAGGSCGYAFKIDEWNEASGMDDSYETMEGNSIVILNSNGKTFDWASEYPVCKVIVKAGRGAYVYSYPNGAYHDEGLIGFQGKGISHVTFCYSEPPQLIIVAKVLYYDGSRNLYCETTGTQAFITDAWCGKLGYNIYPTTTEIELVWPGLGTHIGTVKVENGDVTISLIEGKTLICSYLYIGTLENLQTSNLKADGCPWYSNPAAWKQNTTPLVNSEGLSHMFYDL